MEENKIDPISDDEFNKLLEEKFIELQRELNRQLPIIKKKLKVLEIATIIAKCCLLVLVLDFFSPRNSINIWFDPIAIIVIIITFIFSKLFITYYGRKKYQSGRSSKDPDKN